jgi:RNA polymerase sigma factor (sigma-70 family)
MDDWKLLNDYVTKNSEEAFRALVERYAGMVYHAALRQTGDTYVAEDAAQDVFIALAQKADRIPRQATLYGWLFRATRFAVLNQVRKNVNRERREQKVLVMQTTIESNEADSIRERITPHLNDALEKLSASDREMLMIRFFGNQSHKDVAAALGVSEETARKRISRAIERLRVIFARRGVVGSSVALTAAFVAHGAQAAPVQVAATWAKVAVAKAAAGSAATSGGGILSLMTFAKSPSFIAVLTGAVVITATLIISKSDSHGSPVASPPAIRVATSAAAGASDTNNSLAVPMVTPPKPASSMNTTDALATALDRVRAALHDTNETTFYPNSEMQEAIAGLGDQQKAAIPILEAALNGDANAVVRLRAVDGLGIIGPEARESAPLLLGLLREGGLGQAIYETKYNAAAQSSGAISLPIYTDNMILYTLGRIHPAREILPQFARLIKENQSVMRTVFRACHQFGGIRRSLEAGGWLWSLANEDSQALNDAFRPLLHDPDARVREVSALALVSALGDQADRGVFSVAAELLKADDDHFQRPEGLAILRDAARAAGTVNGAAATALTPARLGSYSNEVLIALAVAADHTTQENLRLAAAKMLDTLSPDFRKVNPLAAELEAQTQSAAFQAKVISGGANLTEVREGLKRFPKTAPAIANYYAGSADTNGIELLPAFTEALSALAPVPGVRGSDRTPTVNARQRLANAMQKIAPGLPKPIFTSWDCMALNRIMADPVLEADAARLQRVSDARKLAEWPEFGLVGNFDVPPEEIRRLLAAVKGADAAIYEALVAKVDEIDPHFDIMPGGGGTGNQPHF